MVMLQRWSMEGEWSCYRGSHLNRGRMVTLQRWNLMQREWSCYGGSQYNGGINVMLRRWPVYWRENGHVAEVASLLEGEWSCCRGGQ